MTEQQNEQHLLVQIRIKKKNNN